MNSHLSSFYAFLLELIGTPELLGRYLRPFVSACTKCDLCLGNSDPLCAAYLETGLRSFSSVGIFNLTEALLKGTLAIEETSAVPVFSCYLCGFCGAKCGTWQLHAAWQYPTWLLELVRALFVESGRIPQQIQKVLSAFSSWKNPWGIARTSKTEWERRFHASINDFRLGSYDYLLLVGEAAFIPDTQHITYYVAKLLELSGLSFGTLKEEEPETGNDVRELGEFGMFLTFVESCREIFKKYNVSRVITISPHDYHTLKHFVLSSDLPIKVFHYTEIFASLVKWHRLSLIRHLPLPVTYQDPCHLGRLNAIYEEPRYLLRRVTKGKLREMQKDPRSSLCCGAGGGRLWYEPPIVIPTRVTEYRLLQAHLTGARFLVTACPYCYLSLSQSQQDKIVVVDISELLAIALGVAEENYGV